MNELNDNLKLGTWLNCDGYAVSNHSRFTNDGPDLYVDHNGEYERVSDGYETETTRIVHREFSGVYVGTTKKATTRVGHIRSTGKKYKVFSDLRNYENYAVVYEDLNRKHYVPLAMIASIQKEAEYDE